MLVHVTIRMEAREDTYERTVFSVFDFTGLVGGVFEIFEILGGVIVGFFAHKLFMFSVLSNLYQVHKITDGKDVDKVIPKTKIVRMKKARSKHDPRMYEESKIPLEKNKVNISIGLKNSKQKKLKAPSKRPKKVTLADK